MTFKLIVLAFIASLSLVQIKSCQTDDRSEKRNEVREVFSISSNVELLFFFKKESSGAERKFFFENILNQPHPGGGYWPRDGIKATFGIDHNGYEGFGFKFSKDATEEQRRDIKRLLVESPLIYRVYENVVPNEIKDLDENKDEVKELFNVESKVELLFFYKKESTYEQRKYFDENILMKNSERGQYMRDGIKATFGIDRNSYEGMGITFRPEATREQREDIKKRLAESPLVHKIYENIVPNMINDL